MSARLARTLVFPLSIAGCASIIGADFDELRPAPSCDTCAAGSAHGGVGSGGTAQAGSTTSGRAGAAGQSSLAGGAATKGGAGGEPPADGGDAGWAGDPAAPGTSCATHLECVERNGGDPYLCRRSRCVRLTTDECPVLLPRGRALDYFRLEPTPIVIGGFASVEPPFFEDTATVNWELALTEFNVGSYGGIHLASDDPRPFVAVVCSSSDADFRPALEHLTLSLGVSGVLSSLPPEKLLAAYDFTSQPDYLLKRGAAVFFLADNAADFRLANLVDRGLVWHMLGDPRMLATTTAGLVRHVEPHVRARRLQDYGVDAPLRLTLLTADEFSLLDAASVLTAGELDSSSNLTFNGELAVAQPDLFRRSSVDLAVEELLSRPPDIVVALAGPEIAGVIDAVESAWGSGSSFGLARPFWVLYDSAAHAPELSGVLAKHDLVSPPPSERLLGVTFAREQSEQAGGLYSAYESRLFSFYENERLAPILAGTQAHYEAAYSLLYGYAAGAANGSSVSGTDLRDELQIRVFSHEADARVYNIGPADVSRALVALRDLKGRISLYGSMGRLTFDPTTGTRVTGTSVWCLEPGNPARPYVYDALHYDPATDTFYAPAAGPGSCAAQYAD